MGWRIIPHIGGSLNGGMYWADVSLPFKKRSTVCHNDQAEPSSYLVDIYAHRYEGGMWWGVWIGQEKHYINSKPCIE